MHSYLPYEDFAECAKVLDSRRLQIHINEVTILLRSLAHVYEKKPRTQLSGFEGHTVGKFWKGHELQLARFGLALVQDQFNRAPVTSADAKGFKERKIKLHKWRTLVEFMEELEWDESKPELIGDEEFHSGFRAFLLFKGVQDNTFKLWKSGHYPDHAVTRNLLPRRASWRRDDYFKIWEFFERPKPLWYDQWGWTEEPDDTKFFYTAERHPHMLKEIERKIERPTVSFLRRSKSETVENST